MEHEGEVSRLRRQIEAEHRASVWALTGLSTGHAQHAFISRAWDIWKGAIRG